MPVLNTMMPAGLAEMATDQLTLDGLMDLLCDYRQTVGGACPIAYQSDFPMLATKAGLVHAIYLKPVIFEWLDEASPNYRMVPLGAAEEAIHGAELALCFRPWCPAGEGELTSAWPDALEGCHATPAADPETAR